eukprot:PhF_6_TR18641/c0_g1_i1/m.27248
MSRYATKPLPAPWEPDDATPACRCCQIRFNFFRRRHHCRKCGRVVCATCSTEKRKGIPGYEEMMSRICSVCCRPPPVAPSSVTAAVPVNQPQINIQHNTPKLSPLPSPTLGSLKGPHRVNSNVSDVSSEGGGCGTPMHIRALRDQADFFNMPPPIPTCSVVPTLQLHVSVHLSEGNVQTLPNVKASYTDTVCDVKKRVLSLLPKDRQVGVDTVSLSVPVSLDFSSDTLPSPEDNGSFKDWLTSESVSKFMQGDPSYDAESKSYPVVLKCRGHLQQNLTSFT